MNSRYLLCSFAWSAAGFALGYLACLLVNRNRSVTTAARLRRRQIRESIGIAILAVCMVLAFIYFRGVDAANDRCFSAFVKAQAETSSIRGALVERESQATRDIIRGALAADTRKELRTAFRDYRRELKAIDKQREDNPIRTFPEGLCS